MKRCAPSPLSLATLLLVLSGCASQEVSKMPVQIMTAPSQYAQASEVMPVKQVLRPQDVLDVIFHIGTITQETYRIQAGDQVEVTFLTANELSGTRLVMPDGSIEMPYVDSIKVAGLTAEEARRLVVARYSRILKKPEIAFSTPRPMAQLENLRTTLNHPASGMSREITVGADGRASFPLIGTLSVQGMDVEQLRETLNQRYAMETGQIRADVLLKSTAANQVFVLGEVIQPGAYPIRRPVSVLEALTLAHGTNPGARLDSVVIMRRQGDQVEAHVYDVDKTLDGSAAAFAYLQPDDLLYVPKTRLAKAGQLSRQLADVILFQGIGFGFAYRVDNKDSDN